MSVAHGPSLRAYIVYLEMSVTSARRRCWTQEKDAEKVCKPSIGGVQSVVRTIQRVKMLSAMCIVIRTAQA